MKLSEIKTAVGALLDKAEADLTVGSFDMFLHAANNARRRAELLHDFEASRITADLSIVGALGGALSAVTNVAGSATGGVKSVTSVSRAITDGFYGPVAFTRADVAIERDRAEQSLDVDYWFNERYPSDANTLTSFRGVVQLGQKLYIAPYDSDSTTTIAVRLNGFGWLPKYTSAVLSTEDVDFVVAFGHEYIQWAAVVELNHMFKQFVPRQEGNIAPPEKLRDEALRNLILWDSYAVDANLTRI